MNYKLTSGALSPHAQEYFTNLMSKSTDANGVGIITGLKDRKVDVSQIGPREDEFKCDVWSTDPYVDMFDSYAFHMGGSDLKRIHIARAARLWSQLVDSNAEEVLSFSDMMNLANRFFAPPRQIQFPDPLRESLRVF